jgi:hypothetical protein
MLSGNSVVCVRHSPLMKRFIRWLHQYIGGYYIKHHVLTQSRPIFAYHDSQHPTLCCRSTKFFE